jgi:type VI secretion system protein ImpM
MSEATLNSAAPGWFGKLPHLGDFASRRLPPSFVRPWDRWLQRGLASARNALGESWLDLYLVAPILRFWLAPGLLDERAWAGLLMPSVDRVGRHFPLTVAQPAGPLAAALVRGAWFDAVDAAARQVLDVEFSVDDLEQVLNRIAALDLPAADAGAERLAARVLERCAAPTPCSVWWTGPASDGAEFRCHAGLPPAAGFATLLGAVV